MMIRRLAAGATTRATAHSLKVTWAVKEATQARIAVYDETGRELDREVQQVAERNVLVLYPTEQEVVIVAHAPADSVFPSGASVELRVATSHPSEESDLIVCAPVDVGGLTRGDVLQVRRDGDDAVVTAPEVAVAPAYRSGSGEHPLAVAAQGPGDVGPEAGNPDHEVAHQGRALGRAEKPSPTPDSADKVALAAYERRQQLVRRACAAARIGIDRQRAETSDLRTVLVALDRSASMMPQLRSGGVEAVLGVLIGVAEVFGTREAQVWAVDAQTALPGGSLTTQSLPECLEAVFGQFTTGMSLVPLLHAMADVDEPTQVYVLTDGVPGDPEGIAEGLALLRAVSVPVEVHVIALAFTAADFRAATRPPLLPSADPLADLVPILNAGLLRLTAISPGVSHGLLEELEDERVVRNLVGSLVPASSRISLSTPPPATANSGVNVS